MTRYDPLSYGQVKMGGDDSAPTDAPDDILFASHGAAPAADSSWGLLDEDVSNLLPGGTGSMSAQDFEADILGAAPAAPPPAAAQVRARPAVKPRPEVASTGRSAAPMPTQRPVAEVARIAAPAASPVVLRRPANVHVGRGSRIAGMLVPVVVLGAGGTGAAWFYAMQQNQVMGGIVIGLTVVAATFARVFLRG
jgi:hypothetical protein